MIDALYVAETGLHAGQKQIETISNNMANLNTVAFKKSRVEFNDMISRNSVSGGLLGEIANNVGQGTNVTNILHQFDMGELKATENPLDLAIQGQGFFEVLLENGELAYTRNGSMKLDSEGYLATLSGYRLSDLVQIPSDATRLEITNDGVINVLLSDGEAYEAGQIQLANFMDAQALESVGSGVFLPTDDAGVPMYSNAGDNGIGNIQQGFLETSNVDLVKELVELVTAQRGYQANSQIIRAADEIMRITNDLRG